MKNRIGVGERVQARHLAGALMLLLGCSVMLPQCDSGGLTAANFVKVSENGFDIEDHAQDSNDYAWSMCYFKPDGSKTGHVYVGTGNNIFGVSASIIESVQNGNDPTDLPAKPPEIRRYRPDIGPKEWEKVFDYREVESDELETYGFRRMITYRGANSDGKGGRSNYLYAASQGLGSTLWRSRTGDAGDWEQVFSTGMNHASIRGMAEHKGRLYIGYAFDIINRNIPPAEIWVSDDGIHFEPVLQDGFGNENNRGVEFLISYNGWLYAGTKNDPEGYEVWKLEGPDGEGPVKIVEHGGPDPRNEAAGTATIFNGKLYVGSLIFYGYNRRENHGFKGCDIIRVNPDDTWEIIVGPHSLSGYDSGFNFFTNAYCWQLKVHDGWLYAGTWDMGNVLAELFYNLPTVVDYFNQKALSPPDTLLTRDLWERLTESGGDIFKTRDGVHWFPVTQDGLGNRNNYGWRTMESTPEGDFYLGAANPYDGLEVWRAVKPAEGSTAN